MLAFVLGGVLLEYKGTACVQVFIGEVCTVMDIACDCPRYNATAAGEFVLGTIWNDPQNCDWLLRFRWWSCWDCGPWLYTFGTLTFWTCCSTTGDVISCDACTPDGMRRQLFCTPLSPCWLAACGIWTFNGCWHWSWLWLFNCVTRFPKWFISLFLVSLSTPWTEPR